MRVLTVRQPWAWAIVHGGKDVENRVRNIAGAYRGPVAIHVAGKYAEMGPRPAPLAEAQDSWCVTPGSGCPRHPWQTNVGNIIGAVDLVDVHLGSRRPDCCWYDARGLKDRCSVWGEDDVFHLVLAQPRPLAEPIPYRGALGLRRLDEDTTARILAAIA